MLTKESPFTYASLCGFLLARSQAHFGAVDPASQVVHGLGGGLELGLLAFQLVATGSGDRFLEFGHLGLNLGSFLLDLLYCSLAFGDLLLECCKRLLLLFRQLSLWTARENRRELSSADHE